MAKRSQSQFKRRFQQQYKPPRFRERIIIFRENRSDRPRKQIPRAVAPSSMTLMNLFCGFAAIVQIHEGNIVEACWLIVIAGFFDLLDGMVARMANATSLFGMELDSLSDVVSFGLATSFLVYHEGLHEWGLGGLIVASLPALGGAIRLARYNTDHDGEKKFYFEGLPIPAQSIAIVSFVLASQGMDLTYFQYGGKSVLAPLTILLSLLMVSTIKFASLPKPSVTSFREKPRLWIGYTICLILTLVFHGTGLFISIVLYLIANLISNGITLVRSIWTETTPQVQG